MIQKKIGFVILHYKVIEETDACIYSIREKMQGNPYFIVVVDNNSENSSGRLLEKKYKNDEDIKIILNKENFGFSKGNNIGCKYVIQNYNPDYLCVLNNDTQLKDDKLLENLNYFYGKYKFDVLGPQIWNTQKNINQNPFYNQPANLQEAKKEMKKINRAAYLSKHNLLILDAISIKMKSMFKKTPKKEISGALNDKNIGLHGAVLIFSKQYYSKYDQVFLEKSFLYFEEAYLNFRRVSDDLVFCYADKILVLHNESASTRNSVKSKNEKWNFQLKYMRKAVVELVKLYENYQE